MGVLIKLGCIYLEFDVFSTLCYHVFVFRACLGLFSIPGPEVQRELNLIASLSLLDDFHVSMLPVQVRLCENKLDIVRAVLDASPTSYKMHDKVTNHSM